MKSQAIQISVLQLVLASCFMLLNIALSLLLRLRLARRLLIASVRMVTQLVLIGMLLAWIFTLRKPFWILLMGLAMSTIASITAVRQTKRRFPSIYYNSFFAILFAAFFVTGLTVTGILRISPWYEPQYLIPLLGMLLGNALNGISLSLDRFTENLFRQRTLIETSLALGASRWEAASDAIRDALRVGMIPQLNTMMVMGIVSMPGTMTGQILAGANPNDAIRYQIVIMFMITACTLLAACGTVFSSFLVLSNPQHQILFDKLQHPSSRPN